MDTIKINVPTFIRLIELAREEVKNDADLHDMTEIVVKLTQEEGVVTMDHYKTIVNYMKTQGNTDELAQIRKLGGF